MCGDHVMRSGRHYATFTLRRMQYRAFVGVIGPAFHPASGTDAGESPQSWMMNCTWGEDSAVGGLAHAGRWVQWEGQPRCETQLEEGDVVVRIFPQLWTCQRRVLCG